MFKLDKSNQKQIADMLHDLTEQLDCSGFDVSYLEVAANIVRLYDAPDMNIYDYWSLERFVTIKGEVNINIDESDVEVDEYHFCAGCGESGACYCTGDEDE